MAKMAETSRLEWADSLKAFLIFTIVVQHVHSFIFPATDCMFVSLFKSFNLAAFFFISGMFAPTSSSRKKTAKALTSLVIPFFVVGGIFTHYYLHSPISTLFNSLFHNGYWFLYLLLIYRLIFILRNYFSQRVKNHSKIALDILLVGLVSFSCVAAKKYLPHDISSIFALNLIHKYILFYFGGFYYKKYILPNKKAPTRYINDLVAVTFIILFLAHLYGYINFSNILFSYLIGFSGTLTAVSVFRYLEKLFAASNILNFIGKHTLEIYVLHCFAIPVGLSAPLSSVPEWGEGVLYVICSLMAISSISIVSILIITLANHRILNFILFGKIPSSLLSDKGSCEKGISSM